MSGNQPTAPARTLVSLAGVDPFVDDQRTLTPAARNFLLRLIGLVGPASGSGTTITQQIADLTAALAAAVLDITTLTASVTALTTRVTTLEFEVAALEAEIGTQPLLPIPTAPAPIPPLRALVPWLQ